MNRNLAVMFAAACCVLIGWPARAAEVDLGSGPVRVVSGTGPVERNAVRFLLRPCRQPLHLIPSGFPLGGH